MSRQTYSLVAKFPCDGDSSKIIALVTDEFGHSILKPTQKLKALQLNLDPLSSIQLIFNWLMINQIYI